MGVAPVAAVWIKKKVPKSCAPCFLLRFRRDWLLPCQRVRWRVIAFDGDANAGEFDQLAPWWSDCELHVIDVPVCTGKKKYHCGGTNKITKERRNEMGGRGARNP